MIMEVNIEKGTNKQEQYNMGRVEESKEKRVLNVVTSHDTLGKTRYPAGLWLSELTHPYFELADNGIDVDIASPKGGKAPIDPFSDPRSPNSISKDDPVNIRFLNSPNLLEKINNTMHLSAINFEDYDAILFSGGSGAVFDFPDNGDVHKAVRSMWESGKLVSSVCAGGSALLNVKLSNGKNLLEGMTVTGFGNEERKMAHQMVGIEYLPFSLQNEMSKRGAIFKQTPNKPFVVVSGGGRLITGQQDLSGSALGRKLVEILSMRGDDPAKT
jgi:Putative intracellular protease/amidase